MSLAVSYTVADIVAVLDAAYPPELAEDWDRVGLICGDPNQEVSSVLVALDCTDEVVAAAEQSGANMIVVHHPLLLRGVSTVAANTPKGRIIHRLIRNNIALFAAHTNADSARPGVNDRLAELLGVTPGAPLAPTRTAPMDAWSVKVPANTGENTQDDPGIDFAAAVKDAVFAAGAGQVGDYEQAAFTIQGRGQFLPTDEANPTIGHAGTVEYVDEVRVEFIADPAQRTAIYQALVAAHPYEEPAFDIVETHVTNLNPDYATGLGRIGKLDTPMRFADFVQRVADRLPETEWGVRGTGDPDRIIETVAVASGSGDSFLAVAAKMGADAFVSSDLRHHPVDEQLRVGGPAIVDTAHWASEFPWCQQAADLLEQALGVEANVTDIRTDPWTISAHKTQEA
ncbi:Nif3-like dinuclear metal center hexameric protein [Corynebacterium ulceribovis]|uniref:Nif3-like dinuclear metal center hexameric protein n=1 Tax=Corynebacterium ulceribovis TaxID=487732 RepID=UPI000373B4CF|nr:Nif3-like dinuclear metal center hexameric protein [Corynebacterium ulceribovis]